MGGKRSISVIGCALALGAGAALPAPAAAAHCPPAPTTVSFERVHSGPVPSGCDETTAPYTFDRVEETGGSLSRVRPTWQSPAAPTAPHGGRWAAKVARTAASGSVYAERAVDWAPEGAAPGTDVHYQARFYLRPGFLAALPTAGAYLIRWESDPDATGRRSCGGVTLERAANPAKGQLRVVRQDDCTSLAPPAPRVVIDGGKKVREGEWIPVWVSQTLSGTSNACPQLPSPGCAGAYTAAMLGRDMLRIARNVNYTGGDAHVRRVRFGLLPAAVPAGGAAHELLMDCAGEAQPCAAGELPLRAALYDPLAPDRWGDPAGSGTEYLPGRGYYAFDPATVQSHIAAMQYAGVQAGISRFEGAGTISDGRLTTLLAEAAAHSGGFRWAINYAPEEDADPSPADIRADLAALVATRPELGTGALHHPSYLNVEGKPVIFVSADADERANAAGAGCDMVRRWSEARALASYHVVMRPFPGHASAATCPATAHRPYSWHDYDLTLPVLETATKPGTSTPWSHWISPGYERPAEPGARLARDFLRWTEGVQAMVDSEADWQLVPFNQWAEGAATESAAQWASPSGHGFYLDTLHSDGVPQHRIVVAAGDIACDSAPPPPPAPGKAERCHHRQVSDIFVRTLPGGGHEPRAGLQAVLALGDTQYDCGQPAEFQAQFHPTWGRVLDLIRPAVGNHEYKVTAGLAGCGGPTAAGYFEYFGSAAAPPHGWYGFGLGPDWHFVVLNTECRPAGYEPAGPCTTEARDAWLADHLAGLGQDAAKKCVAGLWHHPRFGSNRTLKGVSADNWQRQSWELLYASPINADLILNGHAHFYERLRPITPQGADDPAGGIRSIIIGTGGVNVPSFDSLIVPGGYFEPRAETRMDQTYGVGQLVLYDRPNPADPASRGSYSYQFTPDPTQYGPGTSTPTVYQDSFSAGCH